ncbi:cytoplasmic chaperone TorD family protein [Enterovibrio norvegicus FF-162]|uniref:TorD/DmsD family molecular chaperone n=1 Tax=Enterovibrio norvegicus TaxID=188144 RepID=UPI000308CB91|nr:molecular chaperone TorD family protein [Enterovibrio norvegicus]OEE82928.1 cytoplasmic chaperone TorD family protein [Enterovibrio norvegicus FF-162]
MNDSRYETLASLTIASHFFYRALHQAPDAHFINALYDEPMFDEWPLDMANAKVEQGLALLKQRPNLHAASRDYAQLFVGPNTLTAAPWGSVYLTEEQTTCGATTLAIRAFYAEHGIAIDTGEREPEDHIGLVFSFITYLLETAFNAQVVEAAHNESLASLKAFLSDHVLTWAPRFFAIMREGAQTEFYQGISYLAEGTLEQLASQVNAQYNSVNLYR